MKKTLFPFNQFQQYENQIYKYDKQLKSQIRQSKCIPNRKKS